MPSKLIIVDISSFIFRAFFAIRPMHAPDGVQVNAVYGVLTMLIKLIKSHDPSHIVLARDLKGGSFRNELYPAYKANRGAPPEELVPQFDLIDELIQKMCIPEVKAVNYEADDIIGSICVQFKDEFDEILIASGDKDLMQFVDEKVKMLDTMKDIKYGPKEVFEKMGVHPHQIVDYLSLLGDTSDNIPGVKGIGAKGASKLLEEYKTLEAVLENRESLGNKRAKTALENYGEDAHISKKLIQIVTDLDLQSKANDFKFELHINDDLSMLLDRMNFKSLKAKLANSADINTFNEKKSTFVNYEVIKTNKDFTKFIELLNKEDQVYIEPFLTENYHDDDLEFASVGFTDKAFIFSFGQEITYKNFLELISKIEDLKLITLSSKHLHFMAIKWSLEFNNIFDLAQAHFVLDPDKKHDLFSIIFEQLGEAVSSIKELSKESLEHDASIKAFEYGLAKRAVCAMKAYPALYMSLTKNKLSHILNDIDGPLMKVLAQMEYYGINLDIDFYQELENNFQKQVDDIAQKVQEVSGSEVNLKSPKQVSKLLFEDLELPIIKKTKTGASTDSSVLEELKAMGTSEIPGMILVFREIDKLLSTYVKAFPKLVADDGKLRTHFRQDVASTGRLSSVNPNLQNIPVRSENGRKLRQGFTASKGHKLLGADYSQVELRILAHCSEDPVMLEAFKNDEDIHAQTAAQIFDKDIKKVSKEDRSYAKAINFGLMYGQSSFGLSQTLGISRGEAKDFITKYFERFSRVKAYLDELTEKCEQTGYSITLDGRKRIIKDINSSNRQTKSFAQRMAINSPIQGTAADIIKKAMLNVSKRMNEEKVKSKILLQVHDELIFEVPDNEVDQMKVIVRESMEGAASLSIPLRVDMGVGDNWYELK